MCLPCGPEGPCHSAPNISHAQPWIWYVLWTISSLPSQTPSKQSNLLTGLRCPEPIRKGQFIDTYKGEILDQATASSREAARKSNAPSYFLELDKFQAEMEDDEDLYVVDSELRGGVSRFINHSCEPNLRQFSYSLHPALKIYGLAFFALCDIPAYTELTFDYIDPEEASHSRSPSPQDSTTEEGHERVRCLCGSKKCRQFLWK